MTETKEDLYQPRGSPYSFGQYAILILVLTPITAAALSYFGFIPFDVIQASLSGLAFSIVYVGYRWYYSNQYRKDDRGLINQN